jgi:hypothetical protein
VLAAITGLVVAALALPRRPAPADATQVADAQIEAQARSIPRDSAAPPPAAAAVPRSTQPDVLVTHTTAASNVAREAPAKTTKPAKSFVAADVASVASAISTFEKHEADAAASKPVDVPAATEHTPAPARTPTAAPEPVTIVGCLEVNVEEHRFRLTDTEGAGAPRARSWRTGFLKKRSTAVELVGATDGATLRGQVGKRVAVTGALTSRDLEVGAMHVVSPSCR